MSWREQAANFLENLKGLGWKRLAILGFVGLAIFLTVGLSSLYLVRPQYETLYTGLDSQDISRIGLVLNETGIPFDISKDGKTVKVAYGQTAKARMILAEKNLPRSAKSGYELFDNMGSLGLTSFMQEVTLVRALEGEVTRTIQLLTGVKAARVHIVLPKRGSFRRGRSAPTASVVIRTDPTYSFSSAEAIRHLVAAAVPGLVVDAVTVMNTDGSVLASGKNKDSLAPRRQASLELRTSNQIQQNISKTLTPYLGVGNFQVSVAVKLNTDKRQTEETTYDPASRVERSIREIKEKGSAKNANTSTATTVEKDIPENKTNTGPTQNNSENKERKEKLINYEVSKKTTSSVSNGYLINSISIAAVVNRTSLEKITGKKLSNNDLDAQRTEIERLIATAAGISAKRGDQLKVTVVDFFDQKEALPPAPALGIMGHILRLLPNFINGLFLLGVVLIVIKMGLRPVVNTLKDITPVEPPADETPPAIEEDEKVPQLNAPDTGQPLPLATDTENLIADVTGSISQVPMKRLEQMIDFDDKQAAAVLKNWIHEEQRT